MAPYFGDLSQNEKLSEIKQPLHTYGSLRYNTGVLISKSMYQNKMLVECMFSGYHASMPLILTFVYKR